ncbi:MAG: hypothetical protein JXR61_00120 [Prolixibacteraceae bacterium]|nr:hypothetical protein [Prolixibacteraceae bacterium]
MNKIYFFLLFSFWATLQTHAQFAYRINANILTKTRLVDSTFQISKGQIFYDQNYKKIVFDFTFPRKEQIVLFDTTMYIFNKNCLERTETNFLIPEQSFFHFMLTGEIDNFGLYESNFTPSGYEKKNGLIITTWSAPEQIKPIVSKVLIATKSKRLYSITMLDGDEQVMNRQILKKYQQVKGVEIPTEILVATYLTKGTLYQIISLDNIVLNKDGNEELYNYEL